MLGSLAIIHRWAALRPHLTCLIKTSYQEVCVIGNVMGNGKPAASAVSDSELMPLDKEHSECGPLSIRQDNKSDRDREGTRRH